ncbi:Response regulator receiver domain-containing protein [Burkholderia sp. YR290]|nr:Response regulator receiver domain-containing protein [Burkholderia sp. YR290]
MKSKRSSPVIGVVDDDESVRLAISSSLRSANWKVTAYSSADELLGDRRRSELKLVVADIHMPGTDGFGLLEAIRQWQQPVPVIFITAHATHEPQERAKAGGAAGFFAKPVDDERLLALIDELLRT